MNLVQDIVYQSFPDLASQTNDIITQDYLLKYNLVSENVQIPKQEVMVPAHGRHYSHHTPLSPDHTPRANENSSYQAPCGSKNFQQGGMYTNFFPPILSQPNDHNGQVRTQPVPDRDSRP